MATLRNVQGRKVSKVEFGKMYFFRYMPEVPIVQYRYNDIDLAYDMYPLIFCLRRRGNDLEGINFHYLAMRRRLQLYTELSKYFTGTQIDDNTMLKARVLKRFLFQVRKLRAGKIIFRKYKVASIKSKILEVNPTDWETTIFDTSERFITEAGQKLTNRKVWEESKLLIRKN